MPRLHSLERMQSGMIPKEARDAINDAHESLHSVLVHFAKERDARIEIQQYIHNEGRSGWEYVELGDWLRTYGETQRLQVRVQSRDQPRSST
jgi:hypothetical protein